MTSPSHSPPVAGSNIAGSDRAAGAAAPSGISSYDQLLSEANEGLARLEPKLPLSFSFSWRRLKFAAKVEQQGEGIRLRLAGDLGPMPFSAESPKARSRLMNLLRWARQRRDYRFALNDRRRINLLAEAEIEQPITGSAIMTRTAQILLGARPLIDLAAEERLGQQASQGSKANGTPAAPLKRFSAERSKPAKPAR